MSSTNSSGDSRDSGYQPWQVFLLISMGGATWAVIVSRHAHPAALLLMSAAVVSAGFAGLALYHALSGFFSRNAVAGPTSARTREFLEKEKALLLRSIKELEFDRAMGKIGESDFNELSSRMRAKAMGMMAELERPVSSDAPKSRVKSPAAGVCSNCSTRNDADARFCKECGSSLS